MRLPDVIKKSVVFLGVRNADGDYTPGGTGFIVSVGSATVEGRVYHYLVTAQHVVDAIGGRETFVRLNAVDGVATEVSLGNQPDWLFHPTDGESGTLWVDVAALPWNLPLDQFDYQALPATMFTPDAAFPSYSQEPPNLTIGMGLGDGDETFIVGLFTKLVGKKTNLPIVRSGSIAMLPTEPVTVRRFPRSRQTVEMSAYLVEARSIGGLSGSPVFVVPPPGFFGYPTVQYLLGLVHGHWQVEQSAVQTAVDSLETEDAQREGSPLNMGVAIVVPAQSILEVLNQPEAVKMRVKEDKRRDEANLPEPDTVSSDDETGETFTRADFDSALRKASHWITPPNQPSEPDGETS